jgi:hypothetical protein
MAKTKFGKYFLTDAPNDKSKEAIDYARYATRMTRLSGDIIEGAFNFGVTWYNKPFPKALPAHTHDFDEIIGFYGSDPQNPRDLGGEVEFWMEDEKYVLNKSFLVFIPAGVKHCPLKLIRIDRPIFHFGGSNSRVYTKTESQK